MSIRERDLNVKPLPVFQMISWFQRFTKEGLETLDFTIELSLTRYLASDGKYEQEKSDYKECQLDITDSYILMKGRVKDNDLRFC